MVRDSSFGGLVSHIKHHLNPGISKATLQPLCNPSIHPVLHLEFISKSDPFDVQDRPNRRCNEPFKSSQGEADPKRRLLQFDVQEFCDNFGEKVVKSLKDVNQTHKKSTSTHAPVAEPSLFSSKKFKGKSENHVEEFQKFQILYLFLMNMKKI
ncbi:hypothetical protein YC2023_024164 [Brassica napus]